MTVQFHMGIRGAIYEHSSDAVPLGCILVAALLGNLPVLLHLVTSNPLHINADLSPPGSGLLPGVPYIDPNAGYTMQALGHLAALDWLHGHIPWWNPYEGAGSPLAGEMQSGAFFPLTVVLVFHQGTLVLQLLLEAITGWSAYFLARRLGVGRTIATSAGVAFGLCGTYAWLAHAPIRPIAFLPLSLLGVERVLRASREQRAGGWQLLALALALSIMAGFPETALIDGLFVGWWSVLRVAEGGRACWRPMVLKLAVGAAVGVALAAPLLAAFGDYLPYANVGTHGGAIAFGTLSPSGLSQLILPYSLGPIFGLHSPVAANDTISVLWGNVGGFLSVTLIAAGLVGLVGRRLRVLRLGLGGWIAICLLRSYGFLPVVRVMATIPGVRSTAFFRYSDASWELAVVVLAALGLDDIARAASPRRALIGCAFVSAVLAGWATATAWPLLTGALTPTGAPSPHPHWYALGSLVASLVLLFGLIVGAVLAGTRLGPNARARSQARVRYDRTRRRGRVMMAAVVGTESVLLFAFPYLSAPPPTPLQLGSVAYLQSHLGAFRFVTLGPIQPDYGSYFGIAEANINDLPTPAAWTNEVAARLDPNAPANNFTSLARIDPAGPTPAEELSDHLSDYEAVGVRYVVEPASGTDVAGEPFPAHGAPAWPDGSRLVYRDGFAEIWELPAAAPVFSLAAASPGVGHNGAAGCRVNGDGWDTARVICGHRSVLIRRVQYLPGWTASSSRGTFPVHDDPRGPPGLFQEVAVPAGTTTLHFGYLPPHENLALAAAVLAAAVLVGSLAAGSRLRRRQRSPALGGDREDS
ncbi:MAG: hypothetical protein ACLQPH_13970 [Acidimicrobiales bacterium]